VLTTTLICDVSDIRMSTMQLDKIIIKYANIHRTSRYMHTNHVIDDNSSTG